MTAAVEKKMADEAVDLYAVVSEALGDADLLYCDRVWSAWGHGTMGPDDFSPAAEVDGIVESIVEKIRAALAADRSQHDAGYRAGIEAAAKVCDDRGARHMRDAMYARGESADAAEALEAESDECAVEIRALLPDGGAR